MGPTAVTCITPLLTKIALEHAIIWGRHLGGGHAKAGLVFALQKISRRTKNITSNSVDVRHAKQTGAGGGICIQIALLGWSPKSAEGDFTILIESRFDCQWCLHISRFRVGSV